MNNTTKFSILILLGLSLSFCAKKEEPAPTPDYISDYTGTYTGNSFSTVTKAIVEKVSGSEAKVTIITTTSTYGLNMTYSTEIASGTLKYTYFTIPTTSSTSFSAYGSSSDQYTLDATIQNAMLGKSTSGSTPTYSFNLYAKANNGTSLTGLLSK